MVVMDTTIQIDSATRKRLQAEKRGGETYDAVIIRLLNRIGLQNEAANVDKILAGGIRHGS